AMSQFGLEAHTGFFVKSICVLLFLMTFGQMNQLCYCWAMTGGLLWWALTSLVGLGQDDTIAIIATILGLRSVPFLYKRAITIAATYPLQLTFKYVAQIIPKYTISEEEFFTCDGCSAEVGATRKAALVALSDKWKKKYPKCQQFSV
ncbi:unnamed protein product, partial [Polarella glacialis]